MKIELTYRRASNDDLPTIIKLLREDQLGQVREALWDMSLMKYQKAFERIDADPHQYLMVVENQNEIVGTCHLTILPSLTFEGSTRLQIEAVRVAEKCRSQGIGQWMIDQAIEYGKANDASVIQLMSDKRRDKALNFYDRMGFKATHEGMKILLK